MCDRHYLTVGYPYASFVLGLVNTATIAAPANPRIGKHQLKLFIQKRVDQPTSDQSEPSGVTSM
jgi:hypothetical protein